MDQKVSHETQSVPTIQEISEKLDRLNKEQKVVEEHLNRIKHEQLQNLHKVVGMQSREQLVKALEQLNGDKPRHTSGPGKRLTDEERQEVVHLLKTRNTISRIHKKTGISTATIQKIKKKLGMVAIRNR